MEVYPSFGMLFPLKGYQLEFFEHRVHKVFFTINCFLVSQSRFAYKRQKLISYISFEMMNLLKPTAKS